MRIVNILIMFLLVFSTVACDDDSGSGQPNFPMIPGELVADIDDIDFGLSTERKSKTIKIRNSGTLPLAIGAVYMVGAGKDNFKTEPDLITLNNQTLQGLEEIKLSIIFEPTTSTKSEATIRIGELEIEVEGFGLGSWTQVIDNSTQPPARELHSMVYDNKTSSWYMFGGESSVKVFNDFWKLSSTNNKWLEIETPGPKARVNASMMSINNNVYLFGGDSGATIPEMYQDVWIYKTSEGVWAEMKNIGSVAPTDTSSGLAVSIGFTIYYIEPATVSSNVIVYKLATNSVTSSWQPSSSIFMPKLVGKLKAVAAVDDDEIYIMGTDDTKKRNSLWLYEPKYDKFTDLTDKFPKTPFPDASRREFRIAAIDDGFILFTLNASNNNEMWIYDEDIGFTKTAMTGWQGKIANFAVAAGNLRANTLKLITFGGRIIDGAVDNKTYLYQ